MKQILALAAFAASLTASNAMAATYDFSFVDSRSPLGVVTFSLDTAAATGGGNARTATSFSNVAINYAGAAIGFDNFTIAAPTSEASNDFGGRILTATGAFNFDFNPTPATGGGTNILFTPGVVEGFDNVRNDNASLTVSEAGAVSAAPEPGTWALMMLGVGAIGAMLGYRKRVIVDHKAKLAAIG